MGTAPRFLVRPTPRHKSSSVLVLDVKWQSLNTWEMGDMAEVKPASDTCKPSPNQFIQCWFSLALFFAVSLHFTLTRAGAGGCSDLRASRARRQCLCNLSHLQRGRQKFCSVNLMPQYSILLSIFYMIKIYSIKWYGKEISPKKDKVSSSAVL